MEWNKDTVTEWNKNTVTEWSECVIAT